MSSWSGDLRGLISPVLAAYVEGWRDPNTGGGDRKTIESWLEETGAELLVTVDDGGDYERAWMAIDWLARVCVPVWLRQSSLNEIADRLHSLPILSQDSAVDLVPAFHVARVAAEQVAKKTVGGEESPPWVVPDDGAGNAAAEAAFFYFEPGDPYGIRPRPWNVAGHDVWLCWQAAKWAALCSLRGDQSFSQRFNWASVEALSRRVSTVLELQAKALFEQMVSASR